MKLTQKQQRVIHSIQSIMERGEPATTVNIARVLGVKHHRTTQSMLGRLRRMGLVSYCRTLGEWWLTSSTETVGQDTWNISRAAALGVSVRIVEQAPVNGELRAIGFDHELLWPKSQTHQTNWEVELNRAIGMAARTIIRRTARALRTPEREAERVLIRHAEVRREHHLKESGSHPP